MGKFKYWKSISTAWARDSCDKWRNLLEEDLRFFKVSSTSARSLGLSDAGLAYPV